MSEGPSANQPIVIEIRDWNLQLPSIKLCLSCITIIVFVSESLKNHFGKVIKYVLDYATSNTGIKLLSVEIPENIKIPQESQRQLRTIVSVR